MPNLRVYLFKVTIKALTVIQFGAQPGAQLRGALYGYMAQHFCHERGFSRTPKHQTDCPVCGLLALENEGGGRGKDIPRPFLVQPPLSSYYMPHEHISFSLGLVGDKALAALGYVMSALQCLSGSGLGIGRGQYQLLSVEALNPFEGELGTLRPLLRDNRIKLRGDAITHEQVLRRANTLNPKRLRITFLTPTRIIAAGTVLRKPHLGAILRRLVERRQMLETHYGASDWTAEQYREMYFALGAIGDSAQLTGDKTRFLNIESGSQRRGVTSPIGGFVGQAEWVGDFGAALETLVWGQVLQVGKNCVKGNGVYSLEDV